MSDFKGGITFKRGDGGDPTEAFTAVPGLIALSAFGKTNPLIDVTDFDSSAREYIAGLPDGQELTAEFNYDADSATNTQLAGLVSDVDAGTNRNIQVVVNDGTNTETYDFAVTPLSWALNPSFDDKNTISFTLKISGAITKS